MPAPFGYGLWLWLKDNPAAQWALGIGAGLAIFWSWLSLRDIRIRREATAKAEKRAEKQADKIIKEMEDSSDDRIQDAVEARDRVPDDVSSTSGLSDGARSVLFGSRTNRR